MKKFSNEEFVFDSVTFGIDLRERRKELGLSQQKVSVEVLGYTGGTVLSSIELAKYDEPLNLRDFMKLCNFYDLIPSRYFVTEERMEARGADILAGWEF